MLEPQRACGIDLGSVVSGQKSNKIWSMVESFTKEAAATSGKQRRGLSGNVVIGFPFKQDTRRGKMPGRSLS
jgi:hypothetical protein